MQAEREKNLSLIQEKAMPLMRSFDRGVTAFVQERDRLIRRYGTPPDVTISASAKVTGGSVSVFGRTNLPDGSLRLLNLNGRKATATAASHRFDTTLNASKLPSGSTDILIVFDPQRQNAEVSHSYGKTGQYITGKLMSDQGSYVRAEQFAGVTVPTGTGVAHASGGGTNAGSGRSFYTGDWAGGAIGPYDYAGTLSITGSGKNLQAAFTVGKASTGELLDEVGFVNGKSVNGMVVFDAADGSDASLVISRSGGGLAVDVNADGHHWDFRI